MNYISWKVNMQDVQNLMQILYCSLKAKNAPKLKTICKIKQLVSYVLMMRKQNILATLIIFLNQPKLFMKSFMPNRTSKTEVEPLFNFLAKFLTDRKFRMNNFSPLWGWNFLKTLETYFQMFPILLDVFDLQDKLDTIGVRSRPRVISVIYKICETNGTAFYRPISVSKPVENGVSHYNLAYSQSTIYLKCKTTVYFKLNNNEVISVK